MKKIVLFLCFNFPLFASDLPVINLKGDLGGRIDGTPWSSSEIKDKIWVLFYVDPDEKELNDHVGEALKKRNFNRDYYGSIAVINMAATWLPNFVLNGALEEKQEKYADTIYVKDKAKMLVEKWKLADNNSDVLLFDEKGKLLFKYEGKLPPEKVTELVSLVDQHTKRLKK